MNRSNSPWLLLLLLMSAGAWGGERVFRSVDATGHVTYSTVPADGAVELQEVQVKPGPPEQVVEQALMAARTTQQTAEKKFDALMEKRRVKKAEEERRRLAEREAMRERRLQEALERLERQRPVYVYPWPWYGHRPGYPRRSGHRPWRPKPVHLYPPPSKPAPHKPISIGPPLPRRY